MDAACLFTNNYLQITTENSYAKMFKLLGFISCFSTDKFFSFFSPMRTLQFNRIKVHLFIQDESGGGLVHKYPGKSIEFFNVYFASIENKTLDQKHIH